MADIQAPLVRPLAAAEASPSLQASEVLPLVAINFPTQAMIASQVSIQAASEVDGPMEVSSVICMAAVRGRTENHTVRCWRMPLDTHDLYIVRLGEMGTLVYDRSTGLWSEWSSPGLPFWRANIGTPWLGLKKTGATTDIVAGDDTYGLLWIVDTDAGTDQHPESAEEVAFERVVTGMVPMRMRGTQPCNTVYLTADTGYDAGTSWTLRTSDDQGKNWTNHGTVTTRPDDWNQEVSWRALGLIRAPGRLFELSDNGASARINALDMN